jgi:hypothetical protein
VNEAASRTKSELGEEGMVEQEHVQGDNQRDHHRGYGRGDAAVDQSSHHVPVAAVDQERDQGEGDAEGEQRMERERRDSVNFVARRTRKEYTEAKKCREEASEEDRVTSRKVENDRSRVYDGKDNILRKGGSRCSWV